MMTHGVKLLELVLETAQIDWLFVPADRCRDARDEERLICGRFRKPHEPWEPSGAFVMPVCIRRSRRRVLFSQMSGLR
jgi:hypothetical protein